METPTNHTNRNIILVVVVLAIVAICCIAMIIAAVLIGRTGFSLSEGIGDLGSAVATNSYSKSFTVEGPAEVIAEVKVGSIEVMVGEGNTVAVNAEIKGFGSSSEQAQQTLDQVRFEATQSGSTIRITGDWPSGRSWRQSPQFDVRIVVPQRTVLDLNMDVGEITVTGTTGDASIKTDVGKVTLKDVSAEGSLEVQTDVADIEFAGVLTQGADYEFTTDVGAIRLTLPADSRFQIDASSDVGDVNMGFDVVGETSRSFTSKRVEGVVGGDSETTLTLRSNVGGIIVRQR